MFPLNVIAAASVGLQFEIDVADLSGGNFAGYSDGFPTVGGAIRPNNKFVTPGNGTMSIGGFYTIFAQVILRADISFPNDDNSFSEIRIIGNMGGDQVDFTALRSNADYQASDNGNCEWRWGLSDSVPGDFTIGETVQFSLGDSIILPGPELLEKVNPYIDPMTPEWSEFNTAVITIEAAGTDLRITNGITVSAALGIPFTCEIGATYQFEVYTVGTGSGGGRIKIGTTPNGGETATELTPTNALFTMNFVATAVTHYYSLTTNSSTNGVDKLYRQSSVKRVA